MAVCDGLRPPGWSRGKTLTTVWRRVRRSAAITRRWHETKFTILYCDYTLAHPFAYTVSLNVHERPHKLYPPCTSRDGAEVGRHPSPPLCNTIVTGCGGGGGGGGDCRVISSGSLSQPGARRRPAGAAASCRPHRAAPPELRHNDRLCESATARVRTGRPPRPCRFNRRVQSRGRAERPL